MKFTDEAHHGVIRSYTREAGVRNLEREIGNVAAKWRARWSKEGDKLQRSTITPRT